MSTNANTLLCHSVTTHYVRREERVEPVSLCHRHTGRRVALSQMWLVNNHRANSHVRGPRASNHLTSGLVQVSPCQGETEIRRGAFPARGELRLGLPGLYRAPLRLCLCSLQCLGVVLKGLVHAGVGKCYTAEPHSHPWGSKTEPSLLGYEIRRQ